MLSFLVTAARNSSRGIIHQLYEFESDYCLIPEREVASVAMAVCNTVSGVASAAMTGSYTWCGVASVAMTGRNAWVWCGKCSHVRP